MFIFRGYFMLKLRVAYLLISLIVLVKFCVIPFITKGEEINALVLVVVSVLIVVSESYWFEVRVRLI